MNSTRLSVFCDKVLEVGWLLALIITPLFFDVYSSRVFEPDKLTTLRTVAVIMAAVWVVMVIEERSSGRHIADNADGGDGYIPYIRQHPGGSTVWTQR